MPATHVVIPLSPLRKAIAARMTEAVRNIPHFRLGVDIEMDALLGWRKELARTDHRLSLNDLLIKACADALMEVPAVNIQWVDGEIHQYHAADISVVTAVPGGLLTPIVRNADAKTVWEISREVAELTARAESNALKMYEILGGSFSISNLGMYGVDEFDAIVNPPQCAILAVGRASTQLRVTAENQPRAATVLRATLSLDHRAVDGATAANFLQALRRNIEQPEKLFSGTAP